MVHVCLVLSGPGGWALCTRGHGSICPSQACLCPSHDPTALPSPPTTINCCSVNTRVLHHSWGVCLPWGRGIVPHQHFQTLLRAWQLHSLQQPFPRCSFYSGGRPHLWLRAGERRCSRDHRMRCAINCCWGMESPGCFCCGHSTAPVDVQRLHALWTHGARLHNHACMCAPLVPAADKLAGGMYFRAVKVTSSSPVAYNTTPTICPVGTYQPLDRPVTSDGTVRRCLSCPLGRFTWQEGSTSCGEHLASKGRAAMVFPATLASQPLPSAIIGMLSPECLCSMARWPTDRPCDCCTSDWVMPGYYFESAATALAATNATKCPRGYGARSGRPVMLTTPPTMENMCQPCQADYVSHERHFGCLPCSTGLSTNNASQQNTTCGAWRLLHASGSPMRRPCLIGDCPVDQPTAK
jgi:hypothetical protein